ncbi:MAG: hypothetical protein AAF829_12020 [Pseudomonadota bacterium]
MTDDTIKQDTVIEDGQALRDEPIDAEFREAAEPMVQKRGPGWSSAFMMMLLSCLGGGVLGYAGAERVPGLLGGRSGAELPGDFVTESDLAEWQNTREAAADTLSSDLEALALRLANAEGSLETLVATAESDVSDRVAVLTARLDAIETLPTEDGEPTDSALNRSLASAIARIDRLEARIAERDDISKAELTQLRAELDRVASRIDSRSVSGAGPGNTLAEAALALSTIEAAARRGQDFSAAFSVLQRARPESPTVAQIAPIAASGAPTLAQLKSDFDAISRQIEDVLERRGSGGAAGAAGRLFGDLVSVRSPDVSEDFATLDEARTALDRDDLFGASTALSRLEGDAETLAAEWIVQAEARRALERALDTLRLDLMVEDQAPAGAP